MSGERFKRGGRYSIVPAKAVYHDGLTPTDIHVLCAIGHHTNQDGWCFLNQRSIAEAIGITREAVNRSIKRITDAGFMEHMDRNSGKPGRRLKTIHAYRVLMDGKSQPNFDELEAEQAAAEAAISGCDRAITTQHLVDGAEAMADSMCAQDHNGCDRPVTTVVIEPSQLNDPSLTTLPERPKIAEPKRTAPPAAAASPKRGKRRDMFSADATAEAQRLAEKQRLADISAMDEMDYEAYRAVAEEVGIDAPKALTSKRKEHLQTLRDKFGVHAFGKAVENLRNSPFCHGRNKTGWVMRFDEFLKIDLFVKVLEGAFIDRTVVPLPKEAPVSMNEWAARMKIWKELKPGFWAQTWGPAPGQPGCGVPADLLAKYGVEAAA